MGWTADPPPQFPPISFWASRWQPVSSKDISAGEGEFSACSHWPLAQGVHLPAEFEPIEALVLPAGLLAQQHPDLLVQLVEALQNHVRLVGLVSSTCQRQAVEKFLAERKLPSRALRLLEIPYNTLWLRDYGPIFFRLADAYLAAYDAEYPDPHRRLDDAVPGRLAAVFGASVIPLPMVLEGGNLLSNGQGLGLTTSVAVFRQANGSASEASFGQLLYQHLGIDSVLILEPLAGEPTGHVDMFACFTAPDTVLIGQYDPKEEPANAALLDRNASLLAGCRIPSGRLRVVRIPMPPHQDGIWRTYTNVIFANRLLLVPIYPTADPLGSQRALEIYRRLLPGWKVVGIDSSRLIPSGGALRCISLGIPALSPAGSLEAAIGGQARLAWPTRRAEIHPRGFWAAPSDGVLGE